MKIVCDLILLEICGSGKIISSALEMTKNLYEHDGHIYKYEAVFRCEISAVQKTFTENVYNKYIHRLSSQFLQESKF